MQAKITYFLCKDKLSYTKEAKEWNQIRIRMLFLLKKAQISVIFCMFATSKP